MKKEWVCVEVITSRPWSTLVKEKSLACTVPSPVNNNLGCVIKYNQKVFTENKEMKEEAVTYSICVGRLKIGEGQIFYGTFAIAAVFAHIIS